MPRPRRCSRPTDFFPHYTARTKYVAGGEVEVLPLEMIAGTTFKS